VRQAGSASPAEQVQGRRTEQSGFRPNSEGLCAVAVLAVVPFDGKVPGLARARRLLPASAAVGIVTAVPSFPQRARSVIHGGTGGVDRC
jgi:hypothetical protein